MGGASGLPQSLDLGFEVEVLLVSKVTSNSDIFIDGRNGTHCHLMCTICPEHHKCSRRLFKHTVTVIGFHFSWSVYCGILPSLHFDPPMPENKINFKP